MTTFYPIPTNLPKFDPYGNPVRYQRGIDGHGNVVIYQIPHVLVPNPVVVTPPLSRKSSDSDKPQIPEDQRPMVDGLKHGRWILHHPLTGKVVSDGMFDKGFEEGCHLGFFSDGVPYTRTLYKKGKTVGIRTLHWGSGNVRKSCYHDDEGRLIFEQFHDENGIPIPK